MQTKTTVSFELNKEDVSTVSQSETPQEGSIEYLFKDYTGGSFDTELTNPSEPLGNEKW
jgi:antitoxin MazE